MSKADKMFEELGYEKSEKNTRYTYFLKYYKDDDNVIYFNDDWSGKSVHKSGEYDGICDDITMQELQAINEKCKELGWIE